MIEYGPGMLCQHPSRFNWRIRISHLHHLLHFLEDDVTAASLKMPAPQFSKFDMNKCVKTGIGSSEYPSTCPRRNPGPISPYFNAPRPRLLVLSVDVPAIAFTHLLNMLNTSDQSSKDE
jgi:hypothetical protein